MIRPHFPTPSSLDSNTLREILMLYFKELFSTNVFRVGGFIPCDGASLDLTLLKLLCGRPRASLPVNDKAGI